MTDVHEAYVERRRWRVWPIVLLVLVALFGIGLLVAMIMNIHGSITWPAGEVKFGFWPKETPASVATAEIEVPQGQVSTEIPLSPPPPAPQVPQAQPETQSVPPNTTDKAPTENVPVE